MEKRDNQTSDQSSNYQFNRNYHQQTEKREQFVPYAVLALSAATLGLSVYAVLGGALDPLLYDQSNTIVYADEDVDDKKDTESVDDIVDHLGKGHYDISVKVNDDGERSYILTPIESTDEEDSEKSDESDDSENIDENVDGVESDQSEESKDAEKTSNLSEEAQEKLDEHKSMRLRLEPDRDGGDIYYYVVEPGDSLAKISEAFGVPVGQLMEDNHIEDGNLIFVGEVIFMPTDFVK